MQATIRGNCEMFLELRRRVDDEVPLYRENATEDLGELVEESFALGVMAGRIPASYDQLTVEIEPVRDDPPLIHQLRVVLTVQANGDRVSHVQQFQAGRWVRRALLVRCRLAEQGLIGEDDVIYRALVGVDRPEPVFVDVPPFQSPPIREQSLECFGVRRVCETTKLAPDRPILVSARMIEDIIERTQQCGLAETGGMVLGKLVKLDAPLSGTETPIVTILSVALADHRHEGTIGSFAFNPEAVIEAAKISSLRGKGETVQTAWHSHGWGTQCGDCNKKDGCALPECTLVSIDDYQVVESLFPAKTTVMPIAGRRLGTKMRRPNLVIHAWRGGEMKPLPYTAYEE